MVLSIMIDGELEVHECDSREHALRIVKELALYNCLPQNAELTDGTEVFTAELQWTRKE